MLSFKPAFSLSFFIILKRLFSSSSLSAIMVGTEPIEVLSSFAENKSKYIQDNKTLKCLFTCGTLPDGLVEILIDSRDDDH